MSDQKYLKKLKLASKYVVGVDHEFKGDDKDLVEMLIKEAYIAGLSVEHEEVLHCLSCESDIPSDILPKPHCPECGNLNWK